MGKEAAVELGFSEFERDGESAVACETFGCRFDTRFVLTEQGGRTKADVTVTIRPMRFMGGLMSMLMKGDITKGIGKDLEAVALERRRGKVTCVE